MERHRSETALALLTLTSAVIHFSLETWYHVVWSQPILMLLVDYIANVLMLLGAVLSLRNRDASAAGVLAAAWSFTLCLAWIAGFGRLDLAIAGEAAVNGEAGFVMPILVGSVAIVAVIFVWALWLAARPAMKRPKDD